MYQCLEKGTPVHGQDLGISGWVGCGCAVWRAFSGGHAWDIGQEARGGLAQWTIDSVANPQGFHSVLENALRKKEESWARHLGRWSKMRLETSLGPKCEGLWMFSHELWTTPWQPWEPLKIWTSAGDMIKGHFIKVTLTTVRKAD